MLLGAGALVAGSLTMAVNFGFMPESLDPIPDVMDGFGITMPPWLPSAIAVSAANLGAGLLSGKGGLHRPKNTLHIVRSCDGLCCAEMGRQGLLIEYPGSKRNHAQ